jgi:hypothetical protein
MDHQSYTIRVPKPKARIALIVVVVALIAAPLTAVATHSFTDVPDTHTFHEDIEWMKASGVTRGCNPPANTLYCPEDDVKRSQMAAFMRRFSQYLGAEDGTPALADHATTAGNANDAAQLGGQDPAAYDTFVVADSAEGLGDVTGVTAVASTTFSASTASAAVINGTASFSINAGPFADVTIWAQLDDTTCDDPGDAIPGATGSATVAPDGTEPVQNTAAFAAGTSLSAGTHTLTLCLVTNGDIDVDVAGLNGVVSPSASNEVSSSSSASSSGFGR